jgi:hypothetical protein
MSYLRTSLALLIIIGCTEHSNEYNIESFYSDRVEDINVIKINEYSLIYDRYTSVPELIILCKKKYNNDHIDDFDFRLDVNKLSLELYNYDSYHMLSDKTIEFNLNYHNNLFLKNKFQIKDKKILLNDFEKFIRTSQLFYKKKEENQYKKMNFDKATKFRILIR